MPHPTNDSDVQHPSTASETVTPRWRTAVIDGGATATHPSADVGTAGVQEPSSQTTCDEADDSPAIIAHRGFAGVNAENTVGAVVAAARGETGDGETTGGADMIEIDVMPTGDGDVVVFHDSQLAGREGGQRGVTDASGVVWETSTETVTSADVLGSAETVPLLTQVLDAIPASVGVNIDFKNPGSFDVESAGKLSGELLERQRDIWRPFTEDVLGIVDAYENEILVSSFHEAALATVRELSDLPIAPLLGGPVEGGLAIARAYDAEAIHPHYTMIQDTPFYAGPDYREEADGADIDLLTVADDEGRDVNVYTLGTWYQARQLAAAGVDGLIADYPGLL